MPQTATIIAATLPVGQTILTTLTPDVTDTSYSLSFDRTVALGLNVTVGPSIWAFKGGVDYSPDGGVTWEADGGFACEGKGVTSPATTRLSGGIPQGDASPQIRAWFSVPSGVTALVIAGSLSTS